MNENERAAFINSQVACALIELEGMKALNVERQSQGYAIAYDEEAFHKLMDRYVIGHNPVVSYLNQY